MQGEVTGGAGGWRLGGSTLRTADILCIRFAPDLPPSGLASGVFIRGGSLITGTLTSIIGEGAEVSSNALGPLELKRDDIAGAFSPLAPGAAENIPELSRYSSLLAATLGSAGAVLQPGQRCRICLARDEFLADKVMRLGGDQILVALKDKSVETIKRELVRLIEIQTPPVPAGADEGNLGPEVIARLKSGDLIRGRVVKLNEQALTLRTSFMGEKVLNRSILAVLFIAGAPGSGVTWLSAQKPTKSVHVPLFDAEFPARMDSSVDRGDINIGGLPCERGIGVHSRSELEFALSGTPQRFVSVCGIDVETKGRGEVVARVRADGKELWKSPPIAAKDGPQVVSVNLGNAKTLTLQVDFGPDGDDSGDHFDWGWAAVVGK